MKNKKHTWILLSLILCSILFLPSAAIQSFAKGSAGREVRPFVYPVSAGLDITPSEPSVLPSASKKEAQTIEAADLLKEMGDPPFFLEARSDGGILSFSSQNTKVAKVNQSTGQVTIVGAGTAQIVIHASATEQYAEASKIIKLTVKKGTARLKTAKTSYVKPYKSKAFSLGASARCPMKFKSSNPKVARVSGKGRVTVQKCGKTVITVTAGNKDYKTAKKTVSIQVVPETAKIISVKSSSPGQLTVSWKRQREADGYVLEYAADSGFKKNLKKRTVSKNKTVSITLKNLREGKKYYIRVKAYKIISGKKAYGKASKVRSKMVKKMQPQTTAQPGKRTLLNLLLTAKIPLGHTMYVWGGGWNEADTGAGIEAVSIGESPRWRAFYEMQDSSYNYQNTRYQIHDGLDCSGYVGFVVYNVLESVSGKAGYVEKAGGMAESFAKRGFGSYTPFYSVTDWKPGDIMSMKGHVWISLGMCRDGSVVLLHASPPGVLLCGTSLPDGRKSQAVELAESYMSAYYPDWYRKFPDCTRSASYLANSSQMRWSPQALTDEEGIRNMGAEEVLKRIFNVP